MIDFSAEDLLSFCDAAKQIPGRPHKLTIHRWAKEGVRGVRLETVLICGKRYTSKAALNRFFNATASPKGKPPVPWNPKDRREDIRKAANLTEGR